MGGSFVRKASSPSRGIWTRPRWKVLLEDRRPISSRILMVKVFCASSTSQRQGIYIFDEPESALSPSRQIEFLKLIQLMDKSSHCQVIMVTHSPMLMAYPNATLFSLTKYGLEPITVRDTVHFKTMREFFEDPGGFVEAAIGQ